MVTEMLFTSCRYKLWRNNEIIDVSVYINKRAIYSEEKYRRLCDLYVFN